ncbi:Methylcrotonyl-CoA carboxylase carboxyl transferase subunit [hydrothermal vent metagenome]|uniref:Methylcrotonyl-CoA carboxylase carboxyl transferase subunit n=1 Tax=hydrothermal vent metagenome TaxID=652676 RepID=A0A3B0ZXR7_9ZZZZ
MSIINSKIKTSSDEYQKNYANSTKLVNELTNKIKQVHDGGTLSAKEKHIKRGKLLVRDRISSLLDVGSFFMELSGLAGDKLYNDPLPAAGIITGIGIVENHYVMLIANDSTIKGGAYYPITVKKHLRAQEIALENKLPCIYLVDSGGAYLQLQDEIFPDKSGFGRIFYNQARMSAKGIPQISVVLGQCIAGGAYVAAMSDETIVVKNQGRIYLGGPELVQAATGEIVDAETLGGGDMHCRVSGVADHLADNDSHALELCREIINHLPSLKCNNLKFDDVAEPIYDTKEIYGVIPTNLQVIMNPHEIIARIIDGSEFHEFKALYGETVICGFAKIQGIQVGILANNGILFSESSLKATHFIELCNQRGIAIIFLQNIAGFMVGKYYEQHGIAKDGAKMVAAVATSRVPKFTVIVGGSFGAGNYAMCGRAFGARQLWLWPNARISVMGGDVAASLINQIKKPQQDSNLIDDIKNQYEQQGSPYYSTAHLWDDGVIDPAHTRQYLALGLILAQSNPMERDLNNPVFRM